MSVNEEKNLRHNAQKADQYVSDMLHIHTEVLHKVEKLLLDISDRTSNSDLEDACHAYINDVYPVLKLAMED